MIRITENNKRDLQRIINKYLIIMEGFEFENEMALNKIVVLKEEYPGHSEFVQSLNVDLRRS